MEHSHDIVRIEVEQLLDIEYTTLVQRDGNKHIFKNLPKEFFVNRKSIKENGSNKNTSEML